MKEEKANGEEELFRASLKSLGWEELVSELCSRAASEPGKAACLHPLLADSPETAEEMLEECAEMVELFQEGTPPPRAAFSDLSLLVKRAQAQGTLEAHELLSILTMLQHAEECKRFFKERPKPRLSQYASRLSGIPRLRERLEKTIDHEGKLLDSASPALKSLRSQARTLRARILERLSRLMEAGRDSWLQDGFYTQRGDRYVLPVKASEKDRVRGIVHDSSQSGQTVFVEPQELVEPNNRLKLLEAEIQAEIARILKELSRLVAEEGERILAEQSILAHLDALSAKARLALDMRAEKPKVSRERRVLLRSARHPLLVLRKEEVVPNDLELGGETRALIISGPNAGGKTVCLTMLGLLAMMVKAGMFIPAGPDSEMPVFEKVFAVIGDEQDLRQDLSSFSAHLSRVIAVLSASGPGALALFDELMGSTDPEEGAALGAAVLSGLAAKGALVAATTHLPGLKALAGEEPGFVNASFAFEPETLTPSYRLVPGVPGISLGIDMARRLGLPSPVVESAKARLGEDSLKLDTIIRALSQKLSEAEEKLERASAREREAEAEAERLKELRLELEEKRAELKRRAREKIETALREAEEEIKRVKRALRERGIDRAKVAEASRRLREVKESVDSRLGHSARALPPLDWSSARKGDKVLLLPLGVEARLAERPPSAPAPDTMVSVKIGKLTARVPAEKIRALVREEDEELASRGASRRMGKPVRTSPAQEDEEKAGGAEESPSGPFLPQTPRNTLDLRGKRVMEAEVMVDEFLDRACRERLPNVFIIHGHGTGALKQAVREMLLFSPYVEDFRPGEEGEGGDGVTVVRVKDLGPS